MNPNDRGLWKSKAQGGRRHLSVIAAFTILSGAGFLGYFLPTEDGSIFLAAFVGVGTLVLIGAVQWWRRERGHE